MEGGGVWWGADGGQGVLGLGDVAEHAWRATSSVGIPRWRPVVVACRLLVTCCLPDACCLLFTCRFLVACRLACRLSLRVTCFRVSSLSHIVSGWRCCAFAAARGAGPLSSSMGWPAHHSPASTRCTWRGRLSHLLSGVRRHPGAANKVSEGGAMTTGWPLTFPSAHITYVAWALRSFAILLAPSSWGCKRG